MIQGDSASEEEENAVVQVKIEEEVRLATVSR